ncbi:Period circadian protein [Toxocara canis]|uniref:Period circadian protein n=1 Tax=Toxocara canis TaxID=6265 RepID=A0A0B2UM02_TOXCA|nr:Period circadian protein [Toxocara canis]
MGLMQPLEKTNGECIGVFGMIGEGIAGDMNGGYMHSLETLCGDWVPAGTALGISSVVLCSGLGETDRPLGWSVTVIWNMAETSVEKLHPPKAIRRKRLQHYIRQMKQLVAERMPPSDRDDKIGTIEALDKTVELLRATPVYSGERANLSPAHSCSETGENLAVNNNEESWTSTTTNHFARRHIFSAQISLPDGKIIEFRRNKNDTFEPEEERCGSCFFDLLSECGRHALLCNVFTHVQRKRILTRLNGEKRLACELLCDFVRPPDGPLAAHVHALQLPTAFAPSKTFTPLTFTTRHLSTCCLTHLDASAAPYIGHLPGEVIGRSILYLIHPYDLSQMKQIHSELVQQRGGIIRQNRLRWVAFNGSILHTESEWSAYWNPWSMKLDVIVGRHSISEHPIGNADVLSEPSEPRIVTPLTDVAIKSIETDIANIINKQLLASTAPKPSRYRTAPIAHQKNSESSETSVGATHLGNYIDSLVETLQLLASTAPKPSRYRTAPIAHQKNSESSETSVGATHLGNYIDSLVETLVINAGTTTKYSMPSVETGRSTLSPTDLSSVNCSNSIPLSYNQINCLENVHRLLKSHPRTEASSESNSPVKVSPSGGSRSPLPVPEHDDLNKMPLEVGPAMPLTRELLQQHTRKWEQEYRDTWKKRLSMKRSVQQNDFVVPVSAKLFRDASQKPNIALSASGTFACSKPADYWTSSSKDEYYRSLGPNPPPPPGRNFQITSVPLSPPLPIDEHRSAFVSVPPTAVYMNAKSIRELPQPINLSISESVTPVLPSSKLFTAPSQQYHSVIRNTPARTPINSEPLVIPAQPKSLRGLTTANGVDWSSGKVVNDWSLKVGDWLTTEGQIVESKDNCAARLVSLAQRAQQQKQFEQQRRLMSPLESSPVKEATDALMLLQDTA